MQGNVTITVKPDVLESLADKVLQMGVDYGWFEAEALPDRESVKRGIEMWVEKLASEMVSHVEEMGFGSHSSRYGDLKECIQTFSEKEA